MLARRGLREGQKAIANYKIRGEQLFYPNADDPNA
jgi:tungstate transport system substrate-binding protein